MIRLLEKAPASQVESVLRAVAKGVLWGGSAHIEYSRSFALLGYSIQQGLWKSSRMLAPAFTDRISNFMKADFETCFYSSEFEGFDQWSTSTTPHSVDDSELTLAAFAGDMYALGLLPADTARSMIAILCSHFTFIRCHALYLFLLHAKPSLVPRLGMRFLWLCKCRLVWWGTRQPLLKNPNAQKWIREICDVIDQIMRRDMEYATSNEVRKVFHLWDPKLTKKKGLSVVKSNPDPLLRISLKTNW